MKDSALAEELPGASARQLGYAGGYRLVNPLPRELFGDLEGRSPLPVGDLSQPRFTLSISTAH